MELIKKVNEKLNEKINFATFNVIDETNLLLEFGIKEKGDTMKRIQVKCIKKIGSLNIGDVFRAEVINGNEIKLDNGEVYPSMYFVDTWTNSIPWYEK